MDSVREYLSLVLGIVFSVGMPALVSWLKQSTWPTWKKSILALLVAVSLGALTVLVNGNIDLKNLALSITAIFTAATTIYNTFFRETDMNRRLEGKNVL
jgi:hypothetical protein